MSVGQIAKLRILGSQSELSIALSAMFLSGAAFAGLAATVFPAVNPPPLRVPLTVSITGLVVGVLVLYRGRRMRISSAAWISAIYQGCLLVLMLVSTSANRAVITAMLSVAVVVLYAWFFPTIFARLVGYSSLALYSAILSFRYPSNDIYLTSIALIVLTVLLTEVFGGFRANLEKSSLTDSLCGVWNRRGFELLLNAEISTVARTSEPLALIFIDLDSFKAVNDEKGHAEGDNVLRQVAEELVSGVRLRDSVARIGGDEFVLLLPRTSEQEAKVLSERLRKTVVSCGWSCGIAQYQSGESATEFIRRSDIEMLREKQMRKPGIRPRIKETDRQ